VHHFDAEAGAVRVLPIANTLKNIIGCNYAYYLMVSLKYVVLHKNLSIREHFEKQWVLPKKLR
jgi:hypothetical protein